MFQKDGSLVLTQARHAKDILAYFGMSHYTSVTTLGVPNSKLAKNQGNLLDDVITYRSVIGSLQYLTRTN